MSDGLKGMLAMAAACAVWGLSSLYYKALAHVPPLEVLSHRTLWSMMFFGAILGVQGRVAEARACLAQPRLAWVLAITAVMIAVNWLGFIYAVQSGRALEASLGYYIFPLVAVALGYLALGERFSRLQSLAIALASGAVLILTVGLGTLPLVALAIAGTFGCYGLLKKRLPVGPVTGVFLETALLAPLALIWLCGLHAEAWRDLGGRAGGLFGQDAATSMMLVLSGPLTGGPLMLFSYAAPRISYATLGLVQYLNPTLQFAVAVAVFGEAFTRVHAVAFALIWAALVLYSCETWRQDRRAQIRAGSAV